MKKALLFFLTIILLTVFTSCEEGEHSRNPEVIELNTRQQVIAGSGNNFSLELLKQVSLEETDSNIMISPLSVNFAFAMVANGANNNTLDEILITLGYSDFEMSEFNEYFAYIMDEFQNLDCQVELSIANSVWYRDGFNVLPSFLEVNQDYYNAYIESLDFGSSDAVDVINTWVSDNTNDKITEIINQIPSDAVMYLINAVYFWGTWKYEFDASQTQEGEFYLQSGSTVNTDMMSLEASLDMYYNQDLTMLTLPYGRGNFVMDIILPVSTSNTEELIANLSTDQYSELIDGLYSQNVVLSMPKFQFEYDQDLKEILNIMGISDLFGPSADLSGINGTGELFVSKVKHKTYIDVNEEGTEAAAVTSVEVSFTSTNPNDPMYITFDKPFIFFIREKTTGIILFEGVVKNPLIH